jgi:hypothetical protein
MSEPSADTPFPSSYQIMLRAHGAADFKRAGQASLGAQPARGAVIEVECGGRKLRGVVDALFIPPGCEENCVGTIFLSEA